MRSREPVLSRGEHGLLLAACLLLLPALVALGWWLEPDPRGHGTHEQLGAAPCGVLAWTGLPCPGCGVTTSVTLAARGRLFEALEVQPFGLAVLFAAVLLFAGALRSLWRFGRRRRAAQSDDPFWPDARSVKRWGGVLAVLLLVSWVYKVARMTGWL